jgi:hypothetical protein
LWLGLTDERRSERQYVTFGDVGRMIARTAYKQLNHSPILLVGTIAGLLITYILPIAMLVSGSWILATLGATAWLLMAVAYWPMVRFYNRSFWWSFALPAIALFYAGATVVSAIQYWTGRGGQWKGRAQDTA